MLKEQNKIFWIGYSWIPHPEKTHLIVNVIETEFKNKKLVELHKSSVWMGNSIVDFSHSHASQKKKSQANFFEYAWSMDIVPSTFPQSGLVRPTGISGLVGYHSDSSSRTFGINNDWLDQKKKYDTIFEQKTSDILYNIIRNIYTFHRTNDDTQKTIICLQGPCFSQILDKIQMFCAHPEKFLVTFITFFRRYLLPHPFIKQLFTEKSRIYGPDPSIHESSLLRRYYIFIPSFIKERSAPPLSSPNSFTYPIMVEFPVGSYRFSLQQNMRAIFLKALGLECSQGENICEQADEIENFWDWYPRPSTPLKVAVPKFLLKANRASLTKLWGNNATPITSTKVLEVYRDWANDLQTPETLKVVNERQGNSRDQISKEMKQKIHEELEREESKEKILKLLLDIE